MSKVNTVSSKQERINTILKGVLDRCFPVFCLNPFLSLFLGREFNPALDNNIKGSSISWGTIQQIHLSLFTLLSTLCKVGCPACSWGLLFLEKKPSLLKINVLIV